MLAAEDHRVEVDPQARHRTLIGVGLQRRQQALRIADATGLDGAAGELDVTDLDSVAMEYIGGLRDEGKFGYECKLLNTDPGQLVVRAARSSALIKAMKLTLPDLTVVTFSVLVKTVPMTGGTNAVLKGSVDMKITGPVTYS